jgi:microcystin degradation protein MlrC
MVQTILAPIEEQPFDVALLDLHGAMVAEHESDGEGCLLSRIRAVQPDLPIAVTLDLHCNLTQRMVDNCTMMIGFKTYPHVDMYEVGDQIAQVMFRALEGRVSPVMVWGNRPVLAQTLCMGTADAPMSGLQDMTRKLECEGLLAATFFGGFPMADIHDAGISAVVISDGDEVQARSACDRLLDGGWSERAGFIYRGRPLDLAVSDARQYTEGPVLLLDHADNVGSGGTADVMDVIREVHKQELENVAVGAVWDPVAVKKMQEAGLGNRVSIDLGGKTDMPSIGRSGEAFHVEGRVASLSDGIWTVEGPMYTGVEVSTGPTAVLDTGRIRIVVVSFHHEPWDSGIFSNNGINPTECRYLLLKSRIHYRAGFQPIARATIRCDGHGVTTSRNDQLDYQAIRRPIYPLDDNATA